MFNVNGMSATLIQRNRDNYGEYEFYDDKYDNRIDIKVCPYNVDQAIKFGIYTIPEATGYFIIKPNIDVKEGDQILFENKVYTILEVQDNWLWNKKANISLAVK